MFQLSTNPLTPEIEAWRAKISKTLNAQLCSKFVASNLLATEHISSKKFAVVLKGFKKAGAPVGDTHQNSEGFNLFCAVQAEKITVDQTERLQQSRSFGLQGDGGYDKARKPQEATNVRVIEESTGMPDIEHLGFT